MKRLGIAALLLVASSLALAADRDVKTVTRAIEKQYGVKHKGLPLIARMVMKPALWNSGVKLDMAIFEDVPLRPVKSPEIDSLMGTALGSDWSPFVRSESRKTGERSIIYVRTVGEKLEMMIVSIERDEAVVLKLRVKPQEMQKWIDDPEEMAAHRNRQDPNTLRATAKNAKTTSDNFIKTGTE